MKLYALTLAAWRPKADSQDDPNIALHMQTMVALVEGETDLGQEGMRIAHQLFPEVEGWRGHYVVRNEFTQGMQVGPFRLTWQAEEIPSVDSEEASS